MELDYALLAERASRLDDGRLVIYGGDIEGVLSPKLPVLFETTLVAKMLADEEDERPDGHVFAIACSNPKGERVWLIKEESLDEPIPEDELRPAVGLIATLRVIFKEAGIYRIHLFVDGNELKQFPLVVAKETASSAEAKNDENALANRD